MSKRKIAAALGSDESFVMQNGIPVKMLIACLLSCIVGAVVTAVTAHYLLMGAFLFLFVLAIMCALLYMRGKISVEMACLIPILFLCFVYTPLSWFALDGPLGSTPYLSLLFMTLIALTYYTRVRIVLILLHAVLMAGLVVKWFAEHAAEADMIRVVNILSAYAVASALIVASVGEVVRKSLKINRHIMELSLRDELTGLLNRRAINKALEDTEKTYMKGGADYAVAMIDIDGLKEINDSYGHNLGDAALVSFSSCVAAAIRPEDRVGRFGGDEFLMVLPNVDAAGAEDICARIEGESSGLRGYCFSITVSIGCAMRSACAEVAAVLELADRLMYQRKRQKKAERAVL